MLGNDHILSFEKVVVEWLTVALIGLSERVFLGWSIFV